MSPVAQQPQARKEENVKNRLFILAGVLLAAVFIFGQYHEEREYSQEKLLSQIIHRGIQRWHYSDLKIDDNFSEKAFAEFLDYLDAGKRFLLADDIRELEKYKSEVDNQFAAGSTELMQTAVAVLEKRIRQVMGFYGELMAQPFDFTRDESLEFDPEKRTYSANLEQLKEYWRKTLKYQTLQRYIAKVRTEGKKKSLKELETEARQSVLKSFKSTFNRLLQANTNDSLSRYLNSLVQVFDPHTTYYLPVDQQTFEMQISGSFEGIGATLRNEDDYVKVVSIVPGGPSWRGKQLEAGDLILKVAQEGEEPLDIVGMRTVDAVKFIRGKKGTRVRLTVQKPDSRIIEVPIVRDVVVLEETFAKSAVLIHKGSGLSIGYIYLPGFYNAFSKGRRNATDDVKKEVEKLKTKNVSGIIMDLRNNGGGALRDAVRMSGLFIDEGPVVQVKDKQDKIKVLEDTAPGVTYSGPLMVLVNQLSASASEILAAAMQDYNRAIIVGSAHSYGKGTVQAMVDLDRFLAMKSTTKKPFGALTVTIQKFYRVDGTSIQLKGVIPDIVLPDRYDSFEIGERHLENFLQWDTIPSSDYKTWQTEPLVNTEIKAKNRTRVEKNPAFKQVELYVKNVHHMRNNTRYSLNIDEFKKRQESLKKERGELEKYQEEMSFIDVQPSAEVDKTRSERLAEVEKETQERWFAAIKKDFFLGEAVNIMKDFLDQAEKYAKR